MCGRFALSAKTSEIEKLLPKVKLPLEITPRYNIAPTQNIAVITNENPNELVYLRWGLIPSWAKDDSIGNKLINSRAESLLEKPSFRNSFKYRRCIILADSFYEWRQDSSTKTKTPHLIKLKTGEPFAFAGIWDKWTNPEGQIIYSTSIITCEPNKLVSEIHNRMPVILTKERIANWLSNNVSIEELQTYLIPYNEQFMELYAVSNRVNNPSFDDINCTEKI